MRKKTFLSNENLTENQFIEFETPGNFSRNCSSQFIPIYIESKKSNRGDFVRILVNLLRKNLELSHKQLT